MSDILKNRKDAKFIKDLEKKLNDKGYELVSYTPPRVKGTHGSVTVKNPETEEVVESTYSSKTSPRAVKNLVTQITKLFSGRGRRGQGEFKLSLDGSQKEEWFGVLKSRGLSAIGIKAFDSVMDDGQERTMSVILSEIKKWMQENRPESAQGYIPTREQLTQYIRKRRDIKKETKQGVFFYRKD